MSKFFEIKKSNIEDMSFIFDKKTIENTEKLLEKIEKENNNLILKSSQIMQEIIPKSNNIYYEKYNDHIINLKEEIRKHIENTKSDISIDKMKILIRENHDNFINTVQENILRYIKSTEERLKTEIETIKSDNNISHHEQEKVNKELTKFLTNNQYNSSIKGKISENRIKSLVQELYKNGEVIDTTKMKGSGDLILKRNKKPIILIENKCYECNVPKCEIDKFIRDVNNNNCSGILISETSGISLKNNYEIEIINNNILIYIHNMNYEGERLTTAIEIIDSLYEKLEVIKTNIGTINIDEETLERINNQYKQFIIQQQTIITQLTENTQTIISSIKSLNLSEITNILSTKYKIGPTSLSCKYYDYIAFTKRGLINHMNTCKMKRKTETDSDSESSIEIIEEKKSTYEYEEDIIKYIESTYNKSNNLKKDQVKMKDVYNNFKESEIYKSLLIYKLFIENIKNKYGSLIYHNHNKALIISGIVKK